MSASAQCPHPGWEFNIEANAFEGDTLKQITVEGRCNTCHGRLLFRGAPLGIRWDQPTIAADGSAINLVCWVEGEPVDENKPRPGFSVTLVGGDS